MIKSCCSWLVRKRDELMWEMRLKSHNSGEYSMAVVQANSYLEDQIQVYTSHSHTYIGLYDGHGGPFTAQFLNSHLFTSLHKFVTEDGGISDEVIKKAFSETENEFLELVKLSLPDQPQMATVGSCCLLGAIVNEELFVANLGDSRAVLGRRISMKSKKVVAERLSTDHNVAEEEVRMEVEALHPDDPQIVEYTRGSWRIKGIIQVSRSIGDVYLKNSDINWEFGKRIAFSHPLITAEPSVTHRKLKPEDSFLIFASDGLWEQFSDQAAVDIVSNNPRAGIAERLVSAAVREVAKKRECSYGDIKKIKKGKRRNFHDEISVVVVYLDHKPRLTPPTVGYTTAPKDIASLNG